MVSRNTALALGVVLLVAIMGGAYMYQNRELLFQESHLYTLPPLPYAYDALEPYIDAETMKIHYTKHHQAYVDKLNAALKDHPDLRKKSLGYLLTHIQEIPESIRTAIIDNGGGHYNHSFFWICMSPEGSHEPSGNIKELIEKTFGDFTTFKEQFNKAALSVFGSGWAWLVSRGGALKIMITQNQDSPLSEGLTPLLGLDVWEHAYYLKYQNRRAEYSDAWWHVVNWEQVSKNYESAQNSTNHTGA